MNLIELLINISQEAHETLRWIFGRDFSALKKEVFGVSVVDLVALYVALYTTKEIVIFFFKLTSKVLSAIFRNAFNYVGIQALLLLRMFWLRSRATAIYLWEHDLTQEKLTVLSRLLNTHFQKITQRIKR